MIAPTFPDAAEIPWAVERYRVGKHSPGTMKVVAFGPKLLNYQKTGFQRRGGREIILEEELRNNVEAEKALGT